MKIAQRKSRKKPLLIALALIFLLAGGAWAYYTFSNHNKTSNESLTDSTIKQPALQTPKNEQQTANDKKQQAVKDDESSNTTSNQSDNSTLTVSQTASTRDENIYRLRYLIEQNLASGTCTLTLTQNNKVITKTASIQSLSSSSTCQGFDIDVNELSSGAWQANLSVQSGDKTGKTSSTLNI